MDILSMTLQVSFGWLLGCLSPTVQEKIKRGYRIKELKSGVKSEVEELRYLMAVCAFGLTRHTNEMPDEFLSWFSNIVKNYKGEEPCQPLAKLCDELLKVPFHLRNVILHANGNGSIALNLTTHIIPLVDTHTNELLTTSIDYQKKLLSIKRHLHLFNEYVRRLNDDIQSVKGKLSPETYEEISLQLNAEYIQLAIRCRIIADLCSDLILL